MRSLRQNSNSDGKCEPASNRKPRPAALLGHSARIVLQRDLRSIGEHSLAKVTSATSEQMKSVKDG